MLTMFYTLCEVLEIQKGRDCIFVLFIILLSSGPRTPQEWKLDRIPCLVHLRFERNPVWED